MISNHNGMMLVHNHNAPEVARLSAIDGVGVSFNEQVQSLGVLSDSLSRS